MIYLCSHNGVTGVIRADQFDDCVRKKRRELNGYDGWKNLKPFRHTVHYRMVFLFTDKNKPEHHQVVGSLDELRGMISDFAVEYRDFELPPIQSWILIKGEHYVGGSTTIQEAPELSSVRQYLASPSKPAWLLT